MAGYPIKPLWGFVSQKLQTQGIIAEMPYVIVKMLKYLQL